MSKDIIFKIQRFDPEKDPNPYFKEYKIPLTPGLTILEGLFYILENVDGSIAFRSSCRAGVCGSCGLNINGAYYLACETQAAAFDSDVLTIKPLAHMPVIKDLVVDLEPFWAKYRSIKPYLVPGNPDPDGVERVQTQDDRAHLAGLIDCILCTCCHSSCAMTGTDEEYLGPTVLLKADRFVQDSRDQAINERLDLTGGEHGVWRCHTIYNCQAACPKKLDPTGAIADLKRKAISKQTGCSWLGKF